LERRGPVLPGIVAFSRPASAVSTSDKGLEEAKGGWRPIAGAVPERLEEMHLDQKDRHEFL
jgi:hypothetical protein